MASSAERLHLAVASNFRAAAQSLANDFETRSSYAVSLSSGSSGKLYAQIVNGAPFDVFLSADQDKALRLERDGAGIKGSRMTYALGQLVLWSNQEQSDAEQRLKSGDFKRIALANPKLAPYGLAAAEVLSSLGHDKRSKWVMGENVAQTFQFIDSAAVDLGFIAYSQVLVAPLARSGGSASASHDKGSKTASARTLKPTPRTNPKYWLVPGHLHAPIKQDAIQIKASVVATAFMAYLKSGAARQIIASYGYLLTPDSNEPSGQANSQD